jgi:hypothetical protein
VSNLAGTRVEFLDICQGVLHLGRVFIYDPNDELSFHFK